MNITEIFSDSIKYPFSDMPGFVAVGLFSLLTLLYIWLSEYDINPYIYLVSVIISILGSFALYGYSLFVVKSGIYRSNIIPNFNLKRNLINGIKIFIINVIYFIFPVLITMIISYMTVGGWGNGLNALFELGFIGLSVAIISFIIFGLFGVIAIARFANNEKMIDALNIKAIFYDIKKIGVFKIILFLITIVILILIFSYAASLLNYIPYFGYIFASLLFGGFIVLFISRSLGLLYSNAQY